VKFILTTDGTDDTDQKMIHEELSREIIGAAMEVLNELKPKWWHALQKPMLLK
jgi:hypothetical protein